MRVVSLLVACVLTVLVGCRTTRPSIYVPAASVPPEVRRQADEQYARAKACLMESCGVVFSKDYPYSLLLIKGEKKVDGLWAWNEKGVGYVGGMSTGYAIIIACNPTNFGEVSEGVLYHELGHHLILNALQDGSHNPKYDPCFNWSKLPNR